MRIIKELFSKIVGEDIKSFSESTVKLQKFYDKIPEIIFIKEIRF